MLKRLAFWTAPLIFIGVLFYWPVANIVGLGISADTLGATFDRHTVNAIWFTLWQAALSTMLCIVIGVPSAYVLYRKSFRGQRFVRALITVPLVLPTIIVAIAFSNFHFMAPIALIIVAHVFINYSLVVRTVGGVWATMDNETEDAAALAGSGRFRTLMQISLPQLKPAIVSAAALTFLYCSTSYGVILVLGGGMVNSIETEISAAAVQFLDLGKAAGLAILQTLLSIAAFSVSSLIAPAAIGIEQVHEGSPKPRIDLRDWPALAITALCVLGLVALPIVVVLLKAFQIGDSFGIDNFINLAGHGSHELLNVTIAQATSNTVRNVAISSTLAIGFGTLIAYLLSLPSNNRAQLFLQRSMDALFLLPIGISSVVLGFGYLITFGDGPLPLRSSWLVVPLVQSLMALPLVVRLIYPALISIGHEQREAAANAGAHAGQIWFHVESKMIRNVILTAVGFSLIVSIGEFGAASLLAYGDQATLPTVLYALISRPGPVNFGMAMAVSAILIVLTFTLVFAVSRKPREQRQVFA
jgi:thiamine transport system permease protein